MKTGYMILSAASIIPLLSSCASYQKAADSEAWSIKPTYNVRHSTETPDAYYQLGRYYQGQNRYEQAQVAYQKALAIDGAYAEARNGLGVVYAMQGRQQEALEQLRLAVKQAPNAAHIHSNLGYALYLSGSYAEAASTLERAVALEPTNQAAHTNLALALDKAGNRGKAVQVMAQAAMPQPAENAPPGTQEAQQVQTGAATPVITAPAVATTAIPSPAPQQALALPKDWGVITQAVRKTVPLVESHIQAVQIEPNVYELRERTEVQVQAVSIARPNQQASMQPNGRGESSTQMKQEFATTVSLSPDALPKGTPVKGASAGIGDKAAQSGEKRDVASLREHQVKERDRVAAQAVQKPVPVAESRVQAAQQAQAAAPAASPYRIEVSNGNGVTGMARKVAGFLDGEGYSKARLTNQKTFAVSSSRIQYRQGYQEEARLLLKKLPGQPDLVQTEDMRKDISVQIVLGKDMAGSLAYFGSDVKKVKLARTGSDS